MKNFCECNSEWEFINNFECANIQRITQCVGREGVGKCMVCFYNFWYNPLYENMMFDLREMNKC